MFTTTITKTINLQHQHQHYRQNQNQNHHYHYLPGYQYKVKEEHGTRWHLQCPLHNHYYHNQIQNQNQNHKQYHQQLYHPKGYWGKTEPVWAGFDSNMTCAALQEDYLISDNRSYNVWWSLLLHGNPVSGLLPDTGQPRPGLKLLPHPQHLLLLLPGHLVRVSSQASD